MTYRCFTRPWWRPDKSWPNGRRPAQLTRGRTRGRFDTEAEAQAFCKQWNATHEPGPMSVKCEYERVDR